MLFSLAVPHFKAFFTDISNNRDNFWSSEALLVANELFYL